MGKVSGFSRLLEERVVNLFLDQGRLDSPTNPYQCENLTTQKSLFGIFKDFYYSTDQQLCNFIPISDRAIPPKLWSYSPPTFCSVEPIPEKAKILLENAKIRSCSENLKNHYGEMMGLLEKIRYPRNVFEGYISLIVLAQFFSVTCPTLSYFPQFYGEEVTRTCGDLIESKRMGEREFGFEDPDMEFYLVAYFASAYFDAIYKFFTNPDLLEKEKPVWNQTFTYDLQDSDSPLLHGLRGIVAHIGDDLPEKIKEVIRMILQKRYGETDPLKIILNQTQKGVEALQAPFFSESTRSILNYIKSPSFEKYWPNTKAIADHASQEVVFAPFRRDHNRIDSVLRYLIDDTLDVLPDPLTNVFRYFNRKSDGLAYELGFFAIEKLRAKAWKNMLELYFAKTEEERVLISQRISREAAYLADQLTGKNIEFEIGEETLEEIIPIISEKAFQGISSIPIRKTFSLESGDEIFIQYQSTLVPTTRNIRFSTPSKIDLLRQVTEVKIQVKSKNWEKLVVVRFPKKDLRTRIYETFGSVGSIF